MQMQITHDKLIKSPMNYTGGKYSLLSQLLPHFPSNTDYAIDLFCGGCDVGINLETKKVLFNDNNYHLIGLYEVLKQESPSDLLEILFSLLSKYDLSRTDLNGYRYYNCNSNDGLSKYNKERYNILRKDFVSHKKRDVNYYMMLFVLIIFGFNNQIRFNKSGEFNLPVGKRDFNTKAQEKFTRFVERLHEIQCEFLCSDFRELKIDNMSEDTFVYIDPPYLISLATYNEKSGWTANDDSDLLNYLDRLNDAGIKFALSNVITNKGFKNEILSGWLSKNKDNYNVINIQKTYSNSNYQRKFKKSDSQEVLIINY